MDSEPNQPLRVGRITVLPESYEVYVDRERIDLTLTQFRLLSALARRPGWVVSAEQFQQRLSKAGGDNASSSRNVKHHIAALRRRLGPAAAQVQTVRGEGYRLAEPSSALPEAGPRVNAEALDK
ncbi:MAG: winged helix-turn-helix domain-containing protein [Planctomycetota bacterium]